MNRVFVAVFIIFFQGSTLFADGIAPTHEEYEKSKTEKAILLYAVNWGNKEKCGGFKKAQLQNLMFIRLDPFTRSPSKEIVSFDKPPRMNFKDVSLPRVMIVEPGEYALAGFDISLAVSDRETKRTKANEYHLFENDRPIGGTFNVSAGEIVYIGHFGLECSFEPIPWRYYLRDQEFTKYTNELKEQYKYLFDKKITYRLFQTSKFGM